MNDSDRDVWAEHEARRLGWKSAFVPEDDENTDPFEDIEPEEAEMRVEYADGSDEPESDGPDNPDEPNPDGPDNAERAGWVEHSIDVQSMMADVFRPGTNHITDGVRGGGKTFMSVSYAQPMVEGFFRKQAKVILLTNVIFVRRVSKTGEMEEQFVMDDPPGVVHITSMEQMFRVQNDYMKKYGREGVMFLVILDEAQNFLLADEYQRGVSIPFMKFYGTTRKFNTCIWLLTPTINNLPPRARNFLDGDPAGYVSYRWRKNKKAAAHYIKTHGIRDLRPEQIAFFKAGTDIPPVMFMVKGSSWTRPLEELEIGEYGYDHLACADFSMSISPDEDKAFDFDELMIRCSDIPSFQLTSVMTRFFEEMDSGMLKSAPAVSQADLEKKKTVSVIANLRAMTPPMSFRQISKIVEVPEATCRSWLDKYHSASGGSPSDSPGGMGGGASHSNPVGADPAGSSET